MGDQEGRRGRSVREWNDVIEILEKKVEDGVI